jgi:hypothetical protein
LHVAGGLDQFQRNLRAGCGIPAPAGSARSRWSRRRRDARAPPRPRPLPWRRERLGRDEELTGGPQPRRGQRTRRRVRSKSAPVRRHEQRDPRLGWRRLEAHHPWRGRALAKPQIPLHMPSISIHA